MIVISKIFGFILSGYPYFSLLYIIVFWKKIKSDEFYNDILSSSNLIYVILSIPIVIVYLGETFIAWYSGNMYESYAFASRALGYFGWQLYFLFSIITILLPQIFWFKKCRKSLIATIAVSILLLFPSFLELLVPIITSLHKDYLPSKWIYSEPWYIRNILTPFVKLTTYGCCVFAVFFLRKKLIK